MCDAPCATVSEQDRAHWDHESIIVFYRLIAQIICLGHVDGGNPTKKGWQLLLDQFRSETGHPYNLVQIKNKFCSLKISWRHWKQLLGNTTGLGWDLEKGTIVTDDDWWASCIQGTLEVAALKNQRIPNWDDLCCMFGGTRDFSVYGQASQPPVSQPVNIDFVFEATSSVVS